MKILKLSTAGKLAVLMISFFSIISMARAQSVSMSVTNCAVTAPNEIQFDITATNLTAATILHWNSAVIRLSYSTGFLVSTADAVVWGYVNGSDFPLSLPPSANPTFTSNPLGATKLQLQTGNGIYNNSPCNATTAIAAGATAKIGRFFLRDNTNNFVPGQSVGLTWVTSSGLVLYVDCATTVTNFNTVGTRTLNPPCSLTIPSGCTSPTVGGSPSDQSVCTTGTASFTGSFTGGSPVPTTIWQVQTGGVGLFTDLTEAAPYSGTATNTLTITNPNISLSTNRYRMKTANCTDVFTNSALLTVNPNVPVSVSIVANPAGPICAGTSVTFTATPTNGGAAPAYQWQVNAVIVGTNSPNYTNASLVNGDIVTCVLTSNESCITGNPSTSNPLVITVSPNVTAGTVTGTSPLCIGATATYNSNGTAGGTWSSTNALVASVDGLGLVTALTAGSTDITYTVNSGCGSPVSNFQSLTVSPNVTAGTVTGTSPLCIGLTATYNSNGTAGGTWSSTNPLIASVDGAGLVTALTAGSTDITYTVSSGCGSPVSNFQSLTTTSFTSLSGVAGGAEICSNAIVLPGGTSFGGGSCSLIARVVPSGASPVSGSINTCVKIDDIVRTYLNVPYVQRIYNIEPATNAATATATITLYYTQAEFTAYNAARGIYPSIPGGPGDVSGINNIRLTQYHGTGTYPGNYNGGPSELIDPLDANIIWNAGIGRWEITFDVTGFSGFYLSSKVTVLPITLLNFSGRNNGNSNLLEWSTTSEQNSNLFEILRSTDGVNFVKAGTMNAAGNSNSTKNYYFNDNISTLGNNIFYYKLKMVDITGASKLSTTVKIKLNTKGFNMEATPNPFTDHIRINVETQLQENAIFTLNEISGRRIMQKQSALRKGNNALIFSDLSKIPAGVYLLTITTNSQKQTLKVVKQ